MKVTAFLACSVAVWVVGYGIGTARAADPALPPQFQLANAPLDAAASADRVDGRPIQMAPDRVAAPTADTAPETITIVLGGDLGLGGSNEPVDPDGASRHGVNYRWGDLTQGIAPIIDGDVNFANLETVVTDRNDLSPMPKAFNFRSHPAGIRHLVGLGFNVLSTANNHAVDYGRAGLAATLAHLSAMEASGLKAWPGIGHGREHASRPADITVKGARIRIAAIGIGGNSLGIGSDASDRETMLSYGSDADFRETVTRLGNAEGDLRILSVHYGSELQVAPGADDVRRLRDEASQKAGIDVVVGHHAHVAAGVQIANGRLIFYGMGNLLHPGMQNMARLGVCRDYGLMARLHYARGPDGQLKPQAIEAIPLTDMHQSAAPLAGDEGRRRIGVLNHLATGLDDAVSGAKGVRFKSQANGSGLYCMAGADQLPGRIGSLCRDWTLAEPATGTAAQQIMQSCGGSIMVARARDQSSTAPTRPSRDQASPVRNDASDEQVRRFFSAQ